MNASGAILLLLAAASLSSTEAQTTQYKASWYKEVSGKMFPMSQINSKWAWDNGYVDSETTCAANAYDRGAKYYMWYWYEDWCAYSTSDSVTLVTAQNGYILGQKQTTPPPTKSPTTKSPTTKSPTTKSPTTKQPTNAPTAAPTDSPTAAPTDSPTAAPTNAPTAAPTNAPTAAPTDSPTTSAPTSSPTMSSFEAMKESDMTASIGVLMGQIGDTVYKCNYFGSEFVCMKNLLNSRHIWELVFDSNETDSIEHVDTLTTTDGTWTASPIGVMYTSFNGGLELEFPNQCACGDK